MAIQNHTISIDDIIQEIVSAARELPSIDENENARTFPERGYSTENINNMWILKELRNEAEYLKLTSNNPYYTELGKGLKAFIKRVIRKLIKPIVFPLSERQNSFNEHVGKAVEATRIMGKEHQDQLNDVNEQIQELRAQVAFLSAKNEEISRALSIYRWRLFDHLGIKIDDQKE